MPWGGRTIANVVLGAALAFGSARADVSGFLGTWVNPSSDGSGIAEVMILPAGPDHVRVHLYGRCQPLCDFGEQIGHNYFVSPQSDDLRSIAADFNTGSALMHLSLRGGPGGNIRFDVTTEFTGRSERRNFEAGGSLVRAAPSPALAQSAVPVMPGRVQGPRLVEDCVAINPADVYVAPSDRAYKLSDFDRTILDFGVAKLAAYKALQVTKYYGFDEQCFIKRPHPRMIYWRTAGQVPRAGMPGQDCVSVRPDRVAVRGDAVVDDRHTLVDFGDDHDAAMQAASVVRTYRFDRECFVARPDLTMVYWLAQ